MGDGLQGVFHAHRPQGGLLQKKPSLECSSRLQGHRVHHGLGGFHHRDHPKRAAPLAQAAPGATLFIVQHRMLAPGHHLQTQHTRWTCRHTPAATGAAGRVDVRQLRWHGLQYGKRPHCPPQSIHRKHGQPLCFLPFKPPRSGCPAHHATLAGPASRRQDQVFNRGAARHSQVQHRVGALRGVARGRSGHAVTPSLHAVGGEHQGRS